MPRPTRGHTMAMQVGAAELAGYRAAYDGMSPNDPGFTELFDAAEGAAAAVETHVRKISRPDGLSRRAAAGRLVMAGIARAEQMVGPMQAPIGTMALAGVGFEEVA